MNSLSPALLVAVPQLQDPNFARTVTLLIEAGTEGAFGLVINRASPIKLADICAQNSLPCKRELFVRMGGPCEQTRAWILHGPGVSGELSYPIGNGVFLTPTWEMLGKLAQSENEKFQVFLGYAGWGPGQLEKELADGSWLISDFDAVGLLDDDESDLWRKVIRKMGLDPGIIAPGGGGVH